MESEITNFIEYNRQYCESKLSPLVREMSKEG